MKLPTYPRNLYPRNLYPRKSNQAPGFSLVEVLIAGVILFTILLGANKALIAGMAGTRQGASRTAFEAEILNDIEFMQSIDASLIGDPNACSSTRGGAGYLKTKIEAALNPAPTDRTWTRNLDSTNQSILTITYSFQMPEGTGTEKRVVEINPSFLADCT
jgi:hypothetical protein